MPESEHTQATRATERSSENRESTRQQRRRQILDAARDLFVQKGYEATTMAEIARRSGLAVGTLYKFYDDKRHLYDTLVAETMLEFERASLAALRPPPDDELALIERYIDAGAGLFVQHLPIIRVYFAETGAAFIYTNSGLRGPAFESYDRIVAALQETFRRGVAKGRFIELDPRVLALGLEGVHNAFLGALVRDPQSFTSEQIAALTKRMFFQGVLPRTLPGGST